MANGKGVAPEGLDKDDAVGDGAPDRVAAAAGLQETALSHFEHVVHLLGWMGRTTMCGKSVVQKVRKYWQARELRNETVVRTWPARLTVDSDGGAISRGVLLFG